MLFQSCNFTPFTVHILHKLNICQGRTLHSRYKSPPSLTSKFAFPICMIILSKLQLDIWDLMGLYCKRSCYRCEHCRLYTHVYMCCYLPLVHMCIFLCIFLDTPVSFCSQWIIIAVPTLLQKLSTKYKQIYSRNIDKRPVCVQELQRKQCLKRDLQLLI